MSVKPRTVLTILGVAVAVLVAVTVAVLIGRSDPDSLDTAANGPPTTVAGGPSTVTTIAPTTTATTTPQGAGWPVTTGTAPRSTTTYTPPPEAGDDRFDPVADDLTKIDRTDQESVAKAWCSYWSREINESPQEWAKRLSPIMTGSLTDALAELSFAGEGATRRDAAPGALESLNEGRWLVRCSTRTLRPNGEPTGPPEPTSALIVLVKDDDGQWAVGAVDVGGLVLPAGVGQ